MLLIIVIICCCCLCCLFELLVNCHQLIQINIILILFHLTFIAICNLIIITIPQHIPHHLSQTLKNRHPTLNNRPPFQPLNIPHPPTRQHPKQSLILILITNLHQLFLKHLPQPILIRLLY